MAKRTPPSQLKDLTGQQFGRLYVIERNGNRGSHAAWLCRCSCGNLATKSSKHLIGGTTVSCGCFRLESSAIRNTTHGRTNSKEWRIWRRIKERCYYKKSISFKDYGARGISMCEKWHSFIGFFEDMGEIPPGKDSIDRIDNSGPYCKDNCKWASAKEQANNRRNNIVIQFNGMSKTLKEWSEYTGVSYYAMLNRYHRGWSIERMLTQMQAARSCKG